jgi:hypothetical protein
MALNGGVTLKDLLSMPLKQYIAFRKAVEIKQLEQRKRHIHDTAMAFSEPNKAIGEINKDLNELKRGSQAGAVVWDADKDSIKRAKRRWMR